MVASPSSGASQVCGQSARLRIIPEELTCKPGSVPDLRQVAVISLGPVSPRASCSYPGAAAGRRLCAVLGLAPDGVCRAPVVTNGAVSSYLAVSPLPPSLAAGGGLFSVALSLASRPVAVNNHPCPGSPDFPLSRVNYLRTSDRTVNSS